MKKLLFIVFVLIAFIRCKKSPSNSCYYDAIPSSLFFIPKNNGQRLPDSILRNTRIAYLDNGVKKYLTDVNAATDDYANLGILTTRTIGVVSADYNIKTYFLEFPNTIKSDTMYVDYPTKSPATNCQYVLQTIKFNGRLATIDTAFKFQPVYVLNK